MALMQGSSPVIQAAIDASETTYIVMFAGLGPVAIVTAFLYYEGLESDSVTDRERLWLS